MDPSASFYAVAVAASLVAAATDLRRGKIPNVLTLPLIAAALVAQTALRGAWGLTEGFAGLLLCAGVPWVVFRASAGRAIGGGDVKLFGALGALLGPTAGLELELGALLLLLLAALMRLAYAGQLRVLLRSTFHLMTRRRGVAAEAPVMTEMRLGPAIAVAAMATALSQYLGASGSWLT